MELEKTSPGSPGPFADAFFPSRSYLDRSFHLPLKSMETKLCDTCTSGPD